MKVEEQAESPAENLGEIAPAESQPEEQSGMSDRMSSTLAALKGMSGESILNEGIKILEEEGDGGETKAPSESEKQNIDPGNTQEVASDLLKDIVNKEEKKDEEAVEGIRVGEVEVKEEKKEEGITIDSEIFGGKKVVGKKDKDLGDTEYEGSEIANKHIKEQTGYENLDTLISSSLKLKETLGEFEESKNQVSRYEEVFKNMPSQLYEAVDAHLKGNDWKAPILSRPNLDFTKSIEDQTDKNLVDNYAPKEFSSEDWDDYKSDDPDPRLKKHMDSVISSSRENFKKDRNEIDNLQSNRAKEAEDANRLVNTSVDRSIEHLERNIEGIDAAYVKDLRKSLNVKTLSEMFLNKDGSFKEDAALKLVMAKNGHSMMEQYKIIAERRIETSERQAVLERTPDKPKAKKNTADTSSEIRPEVQNRLDQIIGGFKKDTVY